MDASMNLFWNLYFDKVSTDEIIAGNCLLKDYKDDIIDGPILDIGCGQSKELLSFLDSDRQIFAVDNEQLQLDHLKRRVIEKNSSKINNWNFINLNVGKDEMPAEKYSLIICSDLLHFFTTEKCSSIINSLLKNTLPGTLIYIQVHSQEHPYNNPKKPGNNRYFKHFFSKQDLQTLFSPEQFETIYFSELQKKETFDTIKLINLWLDKWFEINSITDKKYIAKEKADYLKNDSQAKLIAIYKVK